MADTRGNNHYNTVLHKSTQFCTATAAVEGIGTYCTATVWANLQLHASSRCLVVPCFRRSRGRRGWWRIIRSCCGHKLTRGVNFVLCLLQLRFAVLDIVIQLLDTGT